MTKLLLHLLKINQKKYFKSVMDNINTATEKENKKRRSICGMNTSEAKKTAKKWLNDFFPEDTIDAELNERENRYDVSICTDINSMSKKDLDNAKQGIKKFEEKHDNLFKVNVFNKTKVNL